ncbi:MAG TPA: hypothetical protein VGQ58_01855 [Candidatus Limnocylindrales bacterium]|jgi:hypothetical protein|nr:hypothetical protein [Candidatus Limnocylindrales bacterium]
MRLTEGRHRATWIGLAVVAVSALVYWLGNRYYNAGRGDLFYLADAFLHGRTWLEIRLSGWDVIVDGNRIFVPFGPFPAIAFMPLVALVGPLTADIYESGINAFLAASAVGLCWMLMGRLGIERLRDRLWLVALFGFSTMLWWVTTRGGVWHTGHLFASILSLGCLIEVWGRQRAFLIGLMAGAAFLTRAPLAFALPFYALMIDRRTAVELPAVVGGSVRDLAARFPIREWGAMGLAFGISIAFFLWYNDARFGSPFESGYGLATLPPFLEAQRELGLFSLRHVPMNLDYLFLKLPRPMATFPFFRPDGLGMSVFVTSPGLLMALAAPWRSPRTWWLAGAAIAVLIPTLFYYGGGWIQYGYRYFLDSVPFIVALCGMAVVRAGRVSPFWSAVILAGVLVNAMGLYWAYNM